MKSKYCSGNYKTTYMKYFHELGDSHRLTLKQIELNKVVIIFSCIYKYYRYI